MPPLQYRMREMRISGVTIARNVVRLGYPFEASIRSLLPLVDELVIGVGDSDDGTWEAIAAIGDPRLKPFRSTWRTPTRGGQVLSEQTNLALERCTGDWAVYLQMDEVLHEDDLDAVRDAITRHHHRRTEGLVFRYLHFVRDYTRVADDWLQFYPRAVRAVKLRAGVESAGDACGFVCRQAGRTRGLIKGDAGARIFHYGWCHPPAMQTRRAENLGHGIFGESHAIEPVVAAVNACVTRRFAGTHPATMASKAASEPRIVETADQSHAPAWLRAAARVAGSPLARRAEARSLAPLLLTNAWWRTVAWWRALAPAISNSAPRRTPPLRPDV